MTTQGVVERKTTIPILSNLLVEAREGRMMITATDLELSVHKGFTDNWLQPTGAQERLMRQYAGCKRFVWNRALSIEQRNRNPPRASYAKAYRASRNPPHSCGGGCQSRLVAGRQHAW
jgi:hypothetical protein